jgi:hypothetical protein
MRGGKFLKGYFDSNLGGTLARNHRPGNVAGLEAEGMLRSSCGLSLLGPVLIQVLPLPLAMAARLNQQGADTFDAEMFRGAGTDAGSIQPVRLGVDPTVVSRRAIWIVEAAAASVKAMRRKSRKFCDLDTTLGFLGVSMSRNLDAKPLTCATYFATSGPRR